MLLNLLRGWRKEPSIPRKKNLPAKKMACRVYLKTWKILKSISNIQITNVKSDEINYIEPIEMGH